MDMRSPEALLAGHIDEGRTELDPDCSLPRLYHRSASAPPREPLPPLARVGAMYRRRGCRSPLGQSDCLFRTLTAAPHLHGFYFTRGAATRRNVGSHQHRTSVSKHLLKSNQLITHGTQSTFLRCMSRDPAGGLRAQNPAHSPQWHSHRNHFSISSRDPDTARPFDPASAM